MFKVSVGQLQAHIPDEEEARKFIELVKQSLTASHAGFCIGKTEELRLEKTPEELSFLTVRQFRLPG